MDKWQEKKCPKCGLLGCKWDYCIHCEPDKWGKEALKERDKTEEIALYFLEVSLGGRTEIFDNVLYIKILPEDIKKFPELERKDYFVIETRAVCIGDA